MFRRGVIAPLLCCLLILLTARTAFAPPNQVGKVGPSTTVQLPEFGIAVDAAGVVAMKQFDDPGGRLQRQRLEAAKAALPGDLVAESPLRMVSLVRLQRALAKQLDAGQKPDEAMLHLAGLQRVQFVFCYPEQHDLVLAGPAEGWAADATGRAVGITTGQPTIDLVDLSVALRAFPPGKKSTTFLGCSIDPSAEGLAQLQKFQQTIPSRVSTSERPAVLQYIANGTRDALGMARIRTFGVPDKSHFAQVLVEADYRMKRIGIGLEKPPIKLASFLDLARTGAHGTLERWWFTPNYKCLRVTEDKLGLELVGQGVQLQTEHKTIGPGGKLLDAGAPSKPSELFCEGFTAKFPDLSERSAIFAQLRQLIDLTVVAAYVQHTDLYGRSGWRAELLLDEARWPVQTGRVMQQVPAAVNAVWRGNRLLAPAGGGVSIHPALALEAENLVSSDAVAVAVRQKAEQPSRDAATDDGPWWWDAKEAPAGALSGRALPKSE